MHFKNSPCTRVMIVHSLHHHTCNANVDEVYFYRHESLFACVEEPYFPGAPRNLTLSLQQEYGKREDSKYKLEDPPRHTHLKPHKHSSKTTYHKYDVLHVPHKNKYWTCTLPACTPSFMCWQECQPHAPKYDSTVCYRDHESNVRHDQCA